MNLKNIEFLIDGNGDVTLGRVGPIRCAGIASDDGRQIAALVRRRSESFDAFLARLDAAFGKALEDDVFVDEINGRTG